jgi:hypothetical protein
MTRLLPLKPTETVRYLRGGCFSNGETSCHGVICHREKENGMEGGEVEGKILDEKSMSTV